MRLRRNTTRHLRRRLARVEDDLEFAKSALRCHAGPSTIALGALAALQDDRPTGEAYDAQRRQDIAAAEHAGHASGWGGTLSTPQGTRPLTPAAVSDAESLHSLPDPPDNVIPLRRR